MRPLWLWEAVKQYTSSQANIVIKGLSAAYEIIRNVSISYGVCMFKQYSDKIKVGALLIALATLSLRYYFYPTAFFITSNAGSGSGAVTAAGVNVAGTNVVGEYTTSVKGKELPIYAVRTAEPKIALSFDAAWGAEDTIAILDILDQHQVKVTFFMTGGWVADYPDMVKEIYARGHDLGNHSENHKQMSKLDTAKQQEEIQKVHDRVKELTGYEMFLFRPPYGDYNSTLIKTVYGANYYPIQWSVDSLDWKDYGRESIIKTVCNHKKLGNGAIILCHNGAKFTESALDEMLTRLEEQGYQMVPLSSLILRDNFHMEADGTQVENEKKEKVDGGTEEH